MGEACRAYTQNRADVFSGRCCHLGQITEDNVTAKYLTRTQQAVHAHSYNPKATLSKSPSGAGR